MIVLSVTNLTKAYGAQVVLQDVSFHVREGDRIGIVGANGAGKTSLLRMLAGELPRDGGDIHLAGNISLGYLKQSEAFESRRTVEEEAYSIFRGLSRMEEELERISQEIAESSRRGQQVERLLEQHHRIQQQYEREGGYTYRSEIAGILNSMAFTGESLHKPVSLLSGGERTRLSLACLLLRKPELLLLDEPTNHLDIGTMKWLEQFLRGYEGTVLLISHDRYFLDQTVNRIFDVDQHRVTAYGGNYTEYVGKKRLRQQEDLKRFDRQQQEIRRQEEMIRRFRQHGTEKLAKRARSREKQLARMEAAEKPGSRAGTMGLRFQEAFKSGTDVLRGEDLAMSFGHGQNRRELFRHVDFDIKRGERICLVGPNGIGKTTLLKLMMGRLEPDQGRLKTGHNVVFGYYDQGQRLLNPANTVLEEMRDAYRLYTDTEIRSLLGRFLFRGDMVFQPIAGLSGGERARLSLLKMMLSGANVLVLDEPTNHLDIASREVVEEALTDFPGTVIVVSHDRYFLNRVPDRILELSAEGLTSYLGAYDYYMEKKQSIASGKRYLAELGQEERREPAARGQGEVRPAEDAAALRKRNKEAEARARRKARQEQQLEERIALLEKEIVFLEKEMCREEVYSDHLLLAEYHKKLELSRESLSRATDEWLILQD